MSESILQYFSVVKKSKDDHCSSSATLPDPRGPLSEKVPSEAIASANAAVAKAEKRFKRKKGRIYT